MPLFRFLMTEGGAQAELADAELTSLDDAKAHAVELVAQHLSVASRSFWQDSDWRLDVMDDRGLVLASLTIVGFDTLASGRL
ncbi:DUF6894 family protein [Methylobacterium sp. C33D]|uniref:DUF6894 family protein n=1 Tax=Methylobacterium mesophilicum TaxID=39956 RepID=UPI002F32E31B